MRNGMSASTIVFFIIGAIFAYFCGAGWLTIVVIVGIIVFGFMSWKKANKFYFTAEEREEKFKQRFAEIYKGCTHYEVEMRIAVSNCMAADSVYGHDNPVTQGYYKIYNRLCYTCFKDKEEELALYNKWKFNTKESIETYYKLIDYYKERGKIYNRKIQIDEAILSCEKTIEEETNNKHYDITKNLVFATKDLKVLKKYYNVLIQEPEMPGDEKYIEIL